ncbi:polar amino acid transport system substrate-binding protein [Paraburkholderia bryophila]|uniref:Polar amino acid transport system substrate-binding protein n=2 Tax=Paraburkholderia bryophila TaxID=420952 RepID=A0A7Z0B4H5_9BURK|nr:polar amino acid transport system substrate-binding protein [Paraburkholderia bryophila]
MKSRRLTIRTRAAAVVLATSAVLPAGLAFMSTSTPAFAQTQSASASQPAASTNPLNPSRTPMASVFAPHGTLRASINLGNPVLASLDPATGQPVGVSVDLATEFARRLGVPLQLVAVKSAGLSVENVNQDKADIGFFAVDPKRGEEIAFTKPYVLIEGFYLVRDASPITRNAQVDQTGVTVAVGKGSAYDLFLTRELQHATLVRIPTSPAVVQGFLDQHLDVAAGVKQQLQKDAGQTGGLRLLDQRFMVIRQAMGVPKARGDDAAAYLASFVEEMKASGFVKAALARHHIDGAAVAGEGD